MYLIKITALIKSLQKETTELVVSKRTDALNLVLVFENSNDVIAWKMEGYTPEMLGWSDKSFLKYREETFTKEDYAN